jgi:hypothetical protein
VAQHDDFDRQVALRAAQEADELDHADERQVEERDHHEGASSPPGPLHGKSWWSLWIAFSARTGSNLPRCGPLAREARPECGHIPAAVLPAEADDELDELIVERWRPRASEDSPTLPLATRELPVPAEQSLGRDEKTMPVPLWKYSADRSEHRSAGW